MDISVVLPVFQEQATIGGLLSELVETLDANGLDY